MRNPIDIYDKSIANQEPLRSLFEKQIISGANNISADDIDRCAQDLIRNNLDAVNAWLELSFPANNGPNGQTILANNASARFFIEFHWINRSKGFHHARRFLDEERTRRKWRFRTGCVIQKGSKVASDKAQAKRPGSLSANAAPSHVMVSLKSNKNIHTKSDTVRCGSAPVPKYKNPHNLVALTSDPRRSTGSVMETSSTVPPKSSSSPTYHRSERLYSSQNKRKFWTTNPSSINNIESSVTSVHPSKRLRTVCDADGGTSKISAGSVKKKWVPVHAAPSLLYVRKLRPRKANQDLSQDLHQSSTPNILTMDNQRVKNLDNTSLFSNDQQTKGTGSVPKLVPLDNSIAGDTKDVVLHEAIMDADETQTDGATWRVKGAKVTTNTDSKLHEWQEPRRSPRIREIESKDMNTCMSVTLLSSNTQNATGGPASNSRPRKKKECDLRSSQISGALSRKRKKSSESNMKQYRIKLDSSSLPVESATQKGEQSTSVNGKPINDGFNFHSAKSHRKKMDNTIHLSVPSSVVDAKSFTKKKQTKNRFRKISASVTGSAINQRFKSDNVPITSQERDSDALLFDRQSERSKQSDKLDFFQSLDIQTNKVDLPVRTLPLMEVTVPTPAGIQHSATCQGDMTTSLVPHSVSSVNSEHTVAEASTAVLESNAVQSNSMASECPSTSAYHVNQHVEILEEELQQPDAGFSSKPFPIYLREVGMDDENTSIMPFDDDMNLPADLTYLEAEDVENEQDDVIDTLCRFPKTPLQFLPPLWAESRQEICESFDWFRSYQGGVYHAHNVAKGYLLGGFPARRDTFAHGGRLIISHGGGKAESIHSKQGQLSSQPATDQLAQDKSVRALWNTYQNNRPLVLLVDERYALFPYDLKAKNVSYAVLGFYTISDAWELTCPYFDKGIPWWHKEASDESCFSVPSAANDDLNDTARAEIIAEGCNATGFTTTVMSQWSNNHDAASELKGIISHKADDEDDIDSKK
ncbi:hypothetical protein JR316_0002470 [Psilocybe cubensis]|uniref:Uncharacterized protein n=1 Tax=Psilocybe cubensis TaxID=181762 RepID=A0ACB8HC34_PSICU|nr:hypothetical protein JR316_0002470 [Psilocybe cubensis]KAH9485560.1 hypothetical protein JR316_0002470 [Psilocybe cubensis]